MDISLFTLLVEDDPMVNCLQCGIGVPMASLSRHIADVKDCDVPQAKLKSFSVPHDVKQMFSSMF